MILDKLLEKKDLQVYIDVRIRQLLRNRKDILKLKPDNRQDFIIKLDARIAELTFLKGRINQLKEYSIKNWK